MDAVDDVENDIRVIDGVVVRVEIESDEAGRTRYDGAHGVIEALRDGEEDAALDELLLRVHEEVVDRSAPHPVGGQPETHITGTAVAQSVGFGALRYDAHVMASTVVRSARIGHLRLQQWVNSPDGFRLLGYVSHPVDALNRRVTFKCNQNISFEKKK